MEFELSPSFKFQTSTPSGPRWLRCGTQASHAFLSSRTKCPELCLTSSSHSREPIGEAVSWGPVTVSALVEGLKARTPTQ